jgi:hypothetical protein
VSLVSKCFTFRDDDNSWGLIVFLETYAMYSELINQEWGGGFRIIPTLRG